MLEQNAYLEPLEDAKKALSKIEYWLSLQYESSVDADTGDNIKLPSRDLDPIHDASKIEAQRIIKSRQASIEGKIEGYKKEFVELQERIKYPVSHKINSLTDFFSGIFSNNYSDIPSYQKIFSFFNRVFSDLSMDYGIGFNAFHSFESLISEVRKLVLAIGASIKLKILDETLKVYPLQNLNQREDELLKLKLFYDTSCCGYFLDMGTFDHPLNSAIWLKITSDLNRDIKILKFFSDEFDKFSLAIENTKVQADLPSDQSIRETELLIDKQLEKVRSSRHAGLRIEFRKIKEAIEQRKMAVINQAKADFAKYLEQFEKWQNITANIENEFKNKQKSAFPWHFFPPSQEDVDALEKEILERREYYKSWPCTAGVFSDKKFELKEYRRILKLMNEMTHDKINKALKTPGFSVKTIQSYIKMYKQLLEKGGYENADDIISEIELKLFIFVHKKHRNKHGTLFAFFFTCSYFDNLSNVGWSDVAANMNGSNYGYKGTRTEAVLTELCWLKNGELSSIAPKQLKEDYIQTQYARGLAS